MCIIYKITNLKNGKVYVGSSSRGTARLDEHRKKLNCGKHTNRHLQLSWNKHGSENFTFEIIENVCDNGLLIEREQHWMDFYMERCEMYNVRRLADRNTGIKHSGETIEILRRISREHFDKNGHKSLYDFWSDKYGADIADVKMSEYKEKHSERVSGENNPMYGKRGQKNPNIKKIRQYRLDGEFIREWDGIVLASDDLLIKAQNISECCLGKRKTAGGYIWKFHMEKPTI